ncbi:lysis system i-spanin subunit Rz [Stutzerimonas stutzeri]|uniref:lysis system i-spanin subunit Rz n=1 Tax=Stutzerimonas stutzeri TaxID=316 RepID=UPI001C2EFD7E|nr:lysis system i-spanin subunit Rz [Stutzerimonas stutzeri]
MIALLKQYRLIAAGGVILTLMAIAALGAWQWQANSYGKRLADLGAEHQAFVRNVAEANAAVIRQQQRERLELEQRLAALDTSSTENLTHALIENDRLERLYSAADDERRRLRIEVRVARADAVVSSATGAGRMGDAATLELSTAAGSAVWGIRRGMIDDQAKLAYLQEWARSVTK